MLEAACHQAAGLAALTPRAAQRWPRLGALVAHGDGASELPLLWQLCRAWEALEYPVVVLDAGAAESPAEPGLLQLLQGEQEFAELATDAPGWPVLPAAQGLLRLARLQPAQTTAWRLQALLTPFAGYDMLMLYAPAALLAQALPHSGLAPLLSVSARAPAQLSGYRALKELLNQGRLRPTIVNVIDEQDAPTRPDAMAWTHNLPHCARHFLGIEVPALSLPLHRREAVQQLALRTLDQALLPGASALEPVASTTAARSL